MDEAREYYLQPHEIDTIRKALSYAKLVTAVEKTIMNEDGTTYKAAEIRIIIKLED